MAAPSKVFKAGRVVIVLSGRMAGKKAVVLSPYDNGTRPRPFSHALVAGIEKAPQKVSKKMNAKKIEKRTNVKIFMKHINYSHMMPTRYVVPDMEAKTLFGDRKVESLAEKAEAQKHIGQVLKQKFLSATDEKTTRDLAFFRRPLRF